MNTLRRILAATVLGASVLAAPQSFAQGTPEQRAACTGDAFRYCAAEIPNVSRITTCMRENLSRLSPACKAAFNQGTVSSSQ